ncbi:MAG: hypothetical protein LBT83_03230, partial [Tannerella sp.]|nr:hypothetical protein [Tannerella sp.]
MIKAGDYSGATGKAFMEATGSLPVSLAAMFGGPAGLIGTSLLSANEKYDELDADTDLSETNKAVNAILTGSFEALTEKMGDVPIGKWLKGLYGSLGKEAAQQTVQKGLSGWLQKQFKKSGLLLAPVSEGVEEATGQLAENITDWATGVNQELHLFSGVPESFVYGAAGGAQFSAVAVPGVLVNTVQRRKVKSNYRNASGAFDATYGEGAAEYRKRLDGIVGNKRPEEVKLGILDIIVDSKLTEEQKQVAIDYIMARRAYSGVAQGENDLLAQTQNQAVELVNQRVNPDMGAVVTVSVGGQEQELASKVVALNPDGTVNREESDQTVYVRDEEGTIRPVPIDQVEGVGETLSQQEAVDQTTQILAQPIIEQQQNDEVREYTAGETVRTTTG